MLIIIQSVLYGQTKAEKMVTLPVDHWPLSDLYGAELLVVCAWQAEAALLPVAP